jgi:hypothetical protein
MPGDHGLACCRRRLQQQQARAETPRGSHSSRATGCACEPRAKHTGLAAPAAFSFALCDGVEQLTEEVGRASLTAGVHETLPPKLLGPLVVYMARRWRRQVKLSSQPGWPTYLRRVSRATSSAKRGLLFGSFTTLVAVVGAPGSEARLPHMDGPGVVLMAPLALTSSWTFSPNVQVAAGQGLVAPAETCTSHTLVLPPGGLIVCFLSHKALSRGRHGVRGGPLRNAIQAAQQRTRQLKQQCSRKRKLQPEATAGGPEGNTASRGRGGDSVPRGAGVEQPGGSAIIENPQRHAEEPVAAAAGLNAKRIRCKSKQRQQGQGPVSGVEAVETEAWGAGETVSSPCWSL